MVHLAPPPPEFDEVLPYLKQGDIITHPYHGAERTILDEKGRVRPEFWEAKQRGIEVDVRLDRFQLPLLSEWGLSSLKLMAFIKF